MKIGSTYSKWSKQVVEEEEEEKEEKEAIFTIKKIYK